MTHDQITAAIAALNLPVSKTVKNQTKTYRVDYTNGQGEPGTIVAVVRWDDRCGNGHNSFSVTATVYGVERRPREEKIIHKSGLTLWSFKGGCCHEDVAHRLPKIAHLIRWHLFDPSGPMHYIANTVYLAGDRETGEGKERELDAARLTACWPDAKDEDLTAPGLEERLIARLPALIAAMKQDIEALGFTY